MEPSINASAAASNMSHSLLSSDEPHQSKSYTQNNHNPLSKRQDSAHGDKSASIPSSILSLIISVVGAGTLGIPYAVAQSGWVIAAILLVVVALLNMFTLHLNLDCAKESAPHSSYSELCQSTIPSLQVLVDVAVSVTIFGSLCAYLVVIGDLMPDAVRTIAGHSSSSSSPAMLRDRHFWIGAFCLLLIVPTVRLKRMDGLRFTSLLAIACFLLITLVVVLYATVDELDPCRGAAVRPCAGAIVAFPRDFVSVFRAAPIFVLTYACHFNVYSMCNELRACTMPRLNVISVCALSACALIYAAVGFGAYFTFGDRIEGNILLMYPNSNSMLVVRVSLSLAIAFGFPVLAMAARRSACSLCFGHSDLGKLSRLQFYGVTYAMVACSLGVAMWTDNITHIFRLVGATGSTLVVFVLPGLFYYNFEFRGQEKSVCKRCASVACVVGGLAFIPFCITMQFL